MENLLANAPKLCRLVQENKPKAKALIKNLTESELIVLIELFLNFNKIGDCTKTVEKHLKKCFSVNSQEVNFPDEENYTFKGFAATIPFHYVCYYDFETWSAPYEEDKAAEELENKKNFSR